MWVRFAGLALAALAAVSAARAESLADRVPDDAMIYVNWRGTEGLGEAYRGSHLRAVVEASDWPKMFDAFLPAVVAKVGGGNAEAAEAMRMVSALGGPIGRHETAFYFGGLIAGQQGGPPSPKLALLVKAGADAPALLAQLNDALAKAGQLPFPVKAAAYGDLVAVTTGAWPAFESLLGAQNQVPAAPALTTNPKFTAAVGQVHKEPVTLFYVDAEAIVRMVDGFVALGVPAEQQRMWHKARQLVGLGGVRQIAVAAAFDGRDWVTDGFVGAPAPRPGLMALLDGGPVTDDAFKLVPQDVTMASAWRCDLAKVVSSAKTTVTATDAQWAQVMDQHVGQASSWAGIDLERDLLAALGDQWAVYASPVVGGNGFLGMCVVSRVRDAGKLEGSLTTLEKRANESIHQMTHGEPTVVFKTLQSGGVTLHYLATPFVTPTWAIVEGNLYVGLYPQVVVAASNYVKGGGPTLLQNEKFVAVRRRVGREEVSSFHFADLPRTAPNAYSSWLLMSRYVGVADLFGIDSPLMLVPPIDRLMPELAPSGQAYWTDDAGWHCRGVTPFPGADVLAQDPLGTLMTAQPALMASIMLPALNRARESANRVKSASNLRQIGQGMMLYSNEHKGEYPASLAELVTAEADLTADMFVSPSSNTAAPGQALDRQKLAEWVTQNSDYVYVGGGKKNTAGPEEIIVYEKPETHGGEGFNVLFGDGHVEWENYDQGMKLVGQQAEKDKATK